MDEKLFIKCHPKHIAWLINDVHYGIIPMKSVIDVGDSINLILTKYKPKTIFMEQPFIELAGSKIEVYRNIQKLQRNAGVIEYLAHSICNADTQYLIHTKEKPSISERLLMVDKLLAPAQFYTPVEMLSLADCILLYKENLIHNTTNNKTSLNACKGHCGAI